MPGSQLKQLKASLKAEGKLGPSKSKKNKQRRQPASERGNNSTNDASSGRFSNGRRLNPFEVQALPRGRQKFDVTDPLTAKDKASGWIQGRPGVSRSLGEEKRRETLLVEMRSRKKAGGIKDKRFGENDSMMDPEERMLQRFLKDQKKRAKEAAVFDLEDVDHEASHEMPRRGGRNSFSQPIVDDYQESDISGSENERRPPKLDENPRKRRKIEKEAAQLDEHAPKRSKAEVMKDVIAKSKLHKYERQQAKEDDDDVREELDKQLPEIVALMKANFEQKQSKARETTDHHINPERAARMLDVIEPTDPKPTEVIQPAKPKLSKYDEQVRMLAFDKRSRPTEKSKTEEEIEAERAERLKKQEHERLQRMQGVDSNAGDLSAQRENDDTTYEPNDDAALFGFGISQVDKEAGVEDEDEFILDVDLIASGSEQDLSDIPDSDVYSGSGSDVDNGSEIDDEEGEGGETNKPKIESNELILDITNGTASSGNTAIQVDAISKVLKNHDTPLLSSCDCPESLEDFRKITRDTPIEDISLVIQRIRSSYQSKTSSDDYKKLGAFSGILVSHLYHLPNESQLIPASTTDKLIRHIHSLAKKFPEEVSAAFRSHLKSIHETRPTNLDLGDLVIFTAIGSVFPTSDHFHAIVTPANLSIARYLATKTPASLQDFGIGCYLVTLVLNYQELSKRYIPEALNYVLAALFSFSNLQQQKQSHWFYSPDIDPAFGMWGSIAGLPDPLSIQSLATDPSISGSSEKFQRSLFRTLLSLLNSMVEMWAENTAFLEMMNPAKFLLHHMLQKGSQPLLSGPMKDEVSKIHKNLKLALAKVQTSRKPLELHHHRPLPIKMAIPKFEESYNPEKRYDPNEERAELGKLRAEYKKERKGALRELRKDAKFMAREDLKEKKERDQEYDRKYKRLVAEIQGQEAHDANEYEREKRRWKQRR